MYRLIFEILLYGKNSSKGLTEKEIRFEVDNFLKNENLTLTQAGEFIKEYEMSLIIGKNKQWKQDINIGKRNNQNFVCVPHNKLINQLKYKCQLLGINVIIQEESYTSKCSFLDDEVVGKHDVYKGRRIKRGMFKTQDGTLINADVNGALNILKKAVGKFDYDPIEVCSAPRIVSL